MKLPALYTVPQSPVLRRCAVMVVASLVFLPALPRDLGAANLVIESWRKDDLPIWQDVIIPAFEQAVPGVKVTFDPSEPDQYGMLLNEKLANGVAGDLITCRPFDTSLDLFKRGYLADLSELPALDNYSDWAKMAWTTDDGTTPFCVPIASVLHGFIYNKAIFEDLGIQVPTTQDDFMSVLETIKQDGAYTPLAMGTLEQWESATLGYQNIGPMYWKGEEGRQAIVDGTRKLTDPDWTLPFAIIAEWSDYLGDSYEIQTYADSQTLFSLGRAAIYPAGSWEIAGFEKNADFELGAFPPPLPERGDTCYVTDQPYLGLGLNPASPNKRAASKFLEWLGTVDFASLYSNALPGYFPLSDHDVELQNSLARNMMSWRENCESTVRLASQFLSRGSPNLWSNMWSVSSNVLNGIETPDEAAAELQLGLESWYPPQQ